MDSFAVRAHPFTDKTDATTESPTRSPVLPALVVPSRFVMNVRAARALPQKSRGTRIIAKFVSGSTKRTVHEHGHGDQHGSIHEFETKNSVSIHESSVDGNNSTSIGTSPLLVVVFSKSLLLEHTHTHTQKTELN